MQLKYHMLDYIYESGTALEKTFHKNEDQLFQTARLMSDKGIEKLILTGLGSSYTAALMAHPLIQSHSPIPSLVVPSTDLDFYLENFIGANTAVITISRSGERGWAVDGSKKCKDKGAMTIAVTGVENSLLAKNASIQWITQEGPEASFPKTKSVIACSGLMMLLGLALSEENDELVQEKIKNLHKMPQMINNTIKELDSQVREEIELINSHSVLVICGTGPNYGTALEGAIKLQETTGKITIGDNTGNFFHGPLTPLDSNWLIITLVHPGNIELNKQFIDLTEEMGAHTLCIADGQSARELSVANSLEFQSSIGEDMSPLIYLPGVQLINYHLAIEMGMNPDKPAVSKAILNAILPPGRSEPDF